MKRHAMNLFVLSAVLAFGATSAFSGCVNPDGTGGCFSSVQAAVDAAVPGETITVADGTYEETIVIGMNAGGDLLHGLTLRGAAKPVGPSSVLATPRSAATIDAGTAPDGTYGIEVIAQDVTIENLIVINGGDDGIHVGCDDGPCGQGNAPAAGNGQGSVVRNVYVNGSGNECIDIEADDVSVFDSVTLNCADKCISWDGVNAVISGNWLRGCHDDGIDHDGENGVISGNFVANTKEGDHCIKISGNGMTVENNVATKCGEDGIWLEGDHAVVRNNSVADVVRDGIHVAPDDFTVENARIMENTIRGAEQDGIFYGPGSNAVIRKNDLASGESSSSNADGIDAAGNGLSIGDNKIAFAHDDAIETFGDGNAITDNEIGHVGGRGIDTFGDDIVITGNSIESTGVYSVSVDGDDALVANNDVGSSKSRALSIAGDRNQVRDNEVGGSTQENLEFACFGGCAGSVISGNTFGGTSHETYDCVDIFAQAAGLLVDGNSATSCAREGFEVSGDGATVSNNSATHAGEDDDSSGFNIFGDNHLIEGNVASFNHDDGINVDGDNHVVRNNVAMQNGGAGIDVTDDFAGATGVVLDGNTVAGNAGAGIEINAAGVTGTVVQNNTGSFNGPDFCDQGAGTVVMPNNTFGTVGACVVFD